MSAHPKIDPMTGEMIAYGYQAKGDLSDDIAVYTINPQGHIVKEVWFKSPYLGIIHDIAITQKYVLIPVVARTTSLERLKTGEPMWEWDGSLPTMVGVLPRDGDARDVRWFKGPARNTLHFLNATDGPNDTITMELPVSDEERSPSHIKRWTFDMNSRNDAFGEEVVSRANGVLARMDDRFLSLPYRYGYVGHNDPERPYDTAAGGNRAGRVTNCFKRFDLANATAPESTFFVGNVQSLQEPGFVPRKGSTAEGDGYVMGVAGNYAEMASELHIVDAQRMEEGAVAVVKLPFRLRGGTHVNWFSSDELAAQKADTV
jgi:carotenoid cleavage dioxygenase